MPEIPVCPQCSAVLPVRDGKTAKFCTRCGSRAAFPAATVPMASAQSAVAAPIRTEPVVTTRPVLPPQDAPLIQPRRWNWGAFLLAPWWSLAQRAYVTATIYFLLDGVVCIFGLMMVMGQIKRGGATTDNLLLYLFLAAVVFLMTALFAIPLAICGDAVALKNRVFAHRDEFHNLQRTWSRWGATVALGIVLPPVVTIAYLLVTVPQTPGGLNIRLLTASTQGNVGEIRAVIKENREKYGVSATNLNWDNAIANAKYSGNVEALKLLEETVAKKRELEARANR